MMTPVTSSTYKQCEVLLQHTGTSFTLTWLLCLQVVGFPDRAAANSFMLLNPNKVTAAVHFDVSAANAVGFTLQTNSTVGRLHLPLLATHAQNMLCIRNLVIVNM